MERQGQEQLGDKIENEMAQGQDHEPLECPVSESAFLVYPFLDRQQGRNSPFELSI